MLSKSACLQVGKGERLAQNVVFCNCFICLRVKV